VDAKPRFSPRSAEQAKAELEQLVHRSPLLLGLPRSRWWLEGIGQSVSWLKNCSLPAIQQIVQRLGLRYKRGREYLHSPDADYDLKLAYVEAAEQLARTQPGRYVLLYQDELTYYRRPTVSRAYALQGHHQALAVQGYGTNQRRRVAGALNAITGHFIAWQRERFDTRTLIAYYQALEAAYPEAEVIFVAQDNWPVHFHPHILQALLPSKISLLRLPTYAPWTNPVEKVWLRLKQQLLHQHSWADDWQALKSAVQAWLDQCDDDPLDLLHFVGLSPY
jgi:hypothetical protein